MDPRAGHLHPKRVRDGLQRVFRGLVPAGERRRGHAVDRRDVHDPASARGTHVREREASEPRGREHHRLERGAGVVVQDVLDCAGDLEPRVVDEAERLELADDAVTRIGVGDVEEHGLHDGAGPLRLGQHVSRLVLGPHAPHGMEPSLGQLDDGGQADPGVRTGGEDGFTHPEDRTPARAERCPRLAFGSRDPDEPRHRSWGVRKADRLGHQA